MAKEERYLIPLALGAHISNIVLIYLLLVFLFSFIGVEGVMAYLFTTLIFAVFIFKEIMFFRTQVKHVPKQDVQKALKAEYSLRKLKRMAKKS